jgi:hypothetical protein
MTAFQLTDETYVNQEQDKEPTSTKMGQPWMAYPVLLTICILYCIITIIIIIIIIIIRLDSII